MARDGNLLHGGHRLARGGPVIGHHLLLLAGGRLNGRGRAHQGHRRVLNPADQPAQIAGHRLDRGQQRTGLVVARHVHGGPQVTPCHLASDSHRRADRAGDGAGHHQRREGDTDDRGQRERDDCRPLEADEPIRLGGILLDGQPPAEAWQVAPGRDHFLTPIVPQGAESAGATGCLLDAGGLIGTEGNPELEGGVVHVPQGSGDEHGIPDQLSGDDFAGVPQPAEIREGLPYSLGAEPERQHAGEPTLIEHRAGDEGQRLTGRSVLLKATQVGLEQGLGPVEAHRQFRGGQAATGEERAGRNRIVERKQNAASGVDQQELLVAEGLGHVGEVGGDRSGCRIQPAAGIVLGRGGPGQVADGPHEGRAAGQRGAVSNSFARVRLQLARLAGGGLHEGVPHRLLQGRGGDAGSDRRQDSAGDQGDHQKPEQQAAGDGPPHGGVLVGCGRCGHHGRASAGLVVVTGLAHRPPQPRYRSATNCSHSRREREIGKGIGRTAVRLLQTTSTCPSGRIRPMKTGRHVCWVSGSTAMMPSGALRLWWRSAARTWRTSVVSDSRTAWAQS